MAHTLTAEMGVSLEDIENFDETNARVCETLDALIAQPMRNEVPRIYHLDVSGMFSARSQFMFCHA